ncbi:MAG: ABC transporter substrate-binding protein, partial [Verrucomicrobiota bacterium]
MTLSIRLFLLFPLMFSGQIVSAQSFPEEGWEDNPLPLASEFAEPGGKISMFASQYPKSFNYHIENNVLAREFFRLMFEQLLTTDPVTLEDRPGLAAKWEISEDKKSFTFHLDPEAKWSDGKPITADDVVWSFEAVKNPEHLTGSLQTVMKRLTKIEKIDEDSVVIHAEEVHWKNLMAASAFYIMPKHWWEGQDFNKVNFEFPVVSGPYALGEVKEGVFARLEKREDYWNAEAPSREGLQNFDTIEFRFYSQRDIA